MKSKKLQEAGLLSLVRVRLCTSRKIINTKNILLKWIITSTVHLQSLPYTLNIIYKNEKSYNEWERARIIRPTVHPFSRLLARPFARLLSRALFHIFTKPFLFCSPFIIRNRLFFLLSFSFSLSISFHFFHFMVVAFTSFTLLSSFLIARDFRCFSFVFPFWQFFIIISFAGTYTISFYRAFCTLYRYIYILRKIYEKMPKNNGNGDKKVIE